MGKAISIHCKCGPGKAIIEKMMMFDGRMCDVCNPQYNGLGLCKWDIPQGSLAYSCRTCDWDMCTSCVVEFERQEDVRKEKARLANRRSTPPRRSAQALEAVEELKRQEEARKERARLANRRSTPPRRRSSPASSSSRSEELKQQEEARKEEARLANKGPHLLKPVRRQRPVPPPRRSS